MDAVALTGRDAEVASTRVKLHVAEQRATWGTKAKREREAQAAAIYHAALARIR